LQDLQQHTQILKILENKSGQPDFFLCYNE
jgi:hypothetical protein